MCHRLTAAANARDPDGPSLQIGNALVFGLCAGDDGPAIKVSWVLGTGSCGEGDQFNGVLT
jgi:hypothetical protein